MRPFNRFALYCAGLLATVMSGVWLPRPWDALTLWWIQR